MRLFVGIPLAPPVMDQLSRLSASLRSHSDGLKWSPPESWHITLQFLGNSSAEQYECLVARLRELRARPVPIQLGGLGLFDRAGIFYAGVDPARELRALERSVVDRTGLCGYLPERRPYQPHVTLARGKGKNAEESFRRLRARIGRPPKFDGFRADAFLLYESFTLSTGAHYEIRERFCLSAERGDTSQ